MDVVSEIAKLKKERNAIILVHNYALPEVQDIGDFVGDSLELSRKAAATKAPVIVFCGVRFMAETAKILSPDSIVIHPRPEAGCLMADMADEKQVAEYRAAHPDALLVAYVNTTAATKTGVDICCTSGNAEKVIRSIPADKEIMFLPDANLGSNVSNTLKRAMGLWHGCCPIHDAIRPEAIAKARAAQPGARVIVHPECKPEIVALADAAKSTGGMLSFIRDSNAKEFIIGTECGMLHRLQKEFPGKVFYSLDPIPVCKDMKLITLEDVRDSLENMGPAVELPAGTIEKARHSIEAMLKI